MNPIGSGTQRLEPDAEQAAIAAADASVAEIDPASRTGHGDRAERRLDVLAEPQRQHAGRGAHSAPDARARTIEIGVRVRSHRAQNERRQYRDCGYAVHGQLPTAGLPMLVV